MSERHSKHSPHNGLIYKDIDFDSSRRDSGTRNRFLEHLDKPIHDIKFIKLNHIEFPYSFYTFNSNTNSLVWQENGQIEVTSTITEGNYTSSTILDEIELQMNADSIAGATYSASLDTDTLKLTITRTGGSGTVEFLINGPDSTCSNLLGYSILGTQAASQTGDRTINLSGDHYVDVRGNVGNLTERNLYSNGSSLNNIIARVPILNDPGSILYYSGNNENYFKANGSINNLEMWLTNSQGDEINLNGGIISGKLSLYSDPSRD